MGLTPLEALKMTQSTIQAIVIIVLLTEATALVKDRVKVGEPHARNVRLCK
jgi:hypothetical protein